MHPDLMNLDSRQQRRLAALLGVDVPAQLSRRVFLQGAGATGLAIGFGWVAPGVATHVKVGESETLTLVLAGDRSVVCGTLSVTGIVCGLLATPAAVIVT